MISPSSPWDPAVLEEVRVELHSPRLVDALARLSIDAEDVVAASRDLERGLENVRPDYEAIIRRIGRPVLYVQDGQVAEPELELWKPQLAQARERLNRAVRSVGRLELRNHPDFAWCGTAWLVRREIVATNRHVATLFTERKGDRIIFSLGLDDRAIEVTVDFAREHQRDTAAEFRVRKVLYVDRGPIDLAFLQVEWAGHGGMPLPEPIDLGEAPESGQAIGCVGYPSWDGRRNDPEWIREIFGDVFGVKRVHPGFVTRTRPATFEHDCSTLGGNSGSPVLDLKTGRAVGLHFSGRFGLRNLAIDVGAVRERLTRIGC